MLLLFISLVAAFGLVHSVINYFENRNKPKLWVDGYGNLINFNNTDYEESVYH
jgi:hypothetical protein